MSHRFNGGNRQSLCHNKLANLSVLSGVKIADLQLFRRVKQIRYSSTTREGLPKFFASYKY
jgi:hypothetical protein